MMKWQKLSIVLFLFCLCSGMTRGQSDLPTPTRTPEPITLDNVTDIRELNTIKADAGVIDIAFNSASSLIAYTTPASLNVWNIPTQTLLWSVPVESGGLVAFSPDSTLLAARVNYDLSLWDVEAGEQRVVLATTEQQIGSVTDVAFVENRNELIGVGDLSGRLLRWKADTGEFVSEYNYGFNEFVGVDYSILSPDGTLNVLSRVTYSIEFRNTIRGDIRNRVQIDELLNFDSAESPAVVAPLAVTNDNQTLLISVLFSTGPLPNQIVWLRPNGEIIHQVDFADERIRTGTFNPDGNIIALGGRENGEIYLLNAVTGEEITTLTGHSDRVTSLAFSPDGTLLASGGTDGTVRLWGVAAGE